MSEGFKQYLPYISSGALKLYIDYGFRSKNETGDSWPSVKTLASDLGVDERTINNWNSELLNLQLIARGSSSHASQTTYLLPTSDIIIKLSSLRRFKNQKLENNDDLKRIVVDYAMATNRNLERVLHLFQWRKNRKKESNNQLYSDPMNVVALCLRRRGIAKQKKTHKQIYIDNYCLLVLDEYLVDSGLLPNGQISMQSEQFENNNHLRFETPLTHKLPFYIKENIGIAINTGINLSKMYTDKNVFELVDRLAKIPISEINDNIQQCDWVNIN